MRQTLALLVALGLSTPALAQIQVANPFNDRMRALSRADQEGALRRAVTLDGYHCGRLSDGAYRGRYGNLGMWVARCTPGGDFAIFIGPNGEAQVRKCADARTLKLPSCGKIGG